MILNGECDKVVSLGLPDGIEDSLLTNHQPTLVKTGWPLVKQTRNLLADPGGRTQLGFQSLGAVISFSSPSGGQIMALRSSGASFRVGRRAHEKMGPAEADPESVPDLKPLSLPSAV